MATSRIFKGLSSALGVLNMGARGNRSGERPAAESAPLTLIVGPKPSWTHLSFEEPWRLAPTWAVDLPADQTAPEAKAMEQSNQNSHFSVWENPGTERPGCNCGENVS